MFKPIAYKSLVFIKLGGLVAKLSVLCSAISTAATMLNDIEFEMGGAIDAVCVVTYLAAIWFSSCNYEKTKHIPPVGNGKTASFASKK